MQRTKLFAALLALILTACTSSVRQPDELPSLSETMDDLVTRFYANFDKPTLDTITEPFILSYLSQEEKEVMSTKYWILNTNVPTTVSLMRDKAQDTEPFWLREAGFVHTEMEVKNTHSTYEVWQKNFPAGQINLGINGFDKHRPVYFIALAPQSPTDELKITPIFPENQFISSMGVGAFTYHDWDGLTLTEVPEALQGHQLLTTIRGRAREAHLINAFRNTDFPSSEKPDQIMLTWSSDTEASMDIQWRTSHSVKTGEVAYWKIGSTDTTRLPADLKVIEDRLLENDRYISRFTASLTGLSAGSDYGYTVGNSTNGWSDAETFRTAEGRSAPFSFVWFGDVHNSNQWGSLIKDAEARHRDARFYIIAGDLVNTGLHRDDWDQLLGYAGKTIARRPLMNVPGNHDSQDGLGAWMYEDLFSYPSNGPADLPDGRSYHFTYNDVLFVMADATLPVDKHVAWMDQVLGNSNAKWKFVVNHFPPYNAVEPYENIIANWVPVFDKHKVDMVMGGHFHYYMRSKPMVDSEVRDQGTRYVISIGTKGKNKEAPKDSFAEVQFAADFLYQHMEVDGNILRYTVYDLEGKIRDSMQITK